MPWCLDLSSHRPVSVRRTTATRSAQHGVSKAALQHPDFSRRVQLAFQDLLFEIPEADAIDRLQFYNQAMATVSRNLSRASTGLTAITTLGDKLGVVMKCLRAAERGVAGGDFGLRTLVS